MLGVLSCSELENRSNLDQGVRHWSEMRASVKLQLAERTFEKGDLEEAAKQCAEVISLAPRGIQGYVLMAKIRLERGEIAQAEAAVSAASRIWIESQTEQQQAAAEASDSKTPPPVKPNPEVLYLKGLIAERRDQIVLANQHFAQACELDPDRVEFLLAYVQALVKLDQVGDALAVLKPQLGNFEQDAAVHTLAGQLYGLQSEWIKASGAYAVALQLKPDDSLLREQAATAFLLADRPYEARQALLPLLEDEASDVPIRLVESTAGALIQHNQPLHALELIEPALKQHPRHVALWQLAVQAHLASHDTPAAERALQQCLRLDPQSEDTHLLQAYCALQKGQRGRAVTIARDLLARNSSDLTVRALLASALKDDPASIAEAAAQYRAIIALEPGNEWARQQLALLSKHN